MDAHWSRLPEAAAGGDGEGGAGEGTAGGGSGGGFTVCVARARAANAFICNETHYRALESVNASAVPSAAEPSGTGGRLRAAYFVRLPCARYISIKRTMPTN